MKHGKKYVDSAKLIDKTKLYENDEAMDICVKTATAKFDETVEVHVKLGVDCSSRRSTGARCNCSAKWYR